MTTTTRLAFAASAILLSAGLGGAPAAFAADSMKGAMMHKHMKAHKGTMMKGGAMKGDAMSKDAAPKTDAQ